MGKKADRQAARIEAARWREFCDSWVPIGQAAEREWRMLCERRTSERVVPIRRPALHGTQLMAMVALMGRSGTRAR